MVYGRPYAGVDNNLTLCSLQSRLQHIYHRQPYARVDLNPMPESTLSLCQSRLYPPQSGTLDLASGHWFQRLASTRSKGQHCVYHAGDQGLKSQKNNRSTEWIKKIQPRIFARIPCRLADPADCSDYEATVLKVQYQY